MAAKKTVKTRAWTTPDQRRELERLRKLSKDAQADVRRLLKRDRNGTLTRKQLQSGLKEVEGDLGGILGFHYFKI